MMRRLGDQDGTFDRSLRRQRGARRVVRTAVLVAVVLLSWPLVEGSRLLLTVPALSPFMATASLVAAQSVQLATWIGLVVSAIVIVRRRWFCRWMCPTGFCADGAGKIGLRFGRRCPRAPPLGRWITLLTLGGAILGYPLLLWLDPLAIFSGLFNAWHTATAPACAWSVVGMLAILAVSAAWPGLWCARICPLGAFQEQLFELARRLPARGIRSPPRSTPAPTTLLSRRAVLGGVLGLGWAAATLKVRGSVAPPLRPPGAVGEDRFAGLCIRCGNCLRACPTAIIRPDLGAHGIAGLLTPTLDYSEEYCREDCIRCTEVCPSGALAPTVAAEKIRSVIGLPHIDMDLCLLGDDRECSMCRNWCPYEAIRYVFSEAEYTLVPKVDPTRCPGCGACELVCPTKPNKAIVVRPR